MSRFDEFVLTIDQNNFIVAELSSGGSVTRREQGKVSEERFLIQDINDGIYELNEGLLNGRTRSIQRVGRDLYRALFPDKIGEAFEQALADLKKNKERSLRMVIEIHPDSSVSKWPLEFLYCPNADYWLATEKPGFALSRRIIFQGQIPAVADTAVPENSSLRVLIIVSKPEGLGGVITTRVLEGISRLTQNNAPSEGEQQSEPSITKNIDVKVIGKLENYEIVPGIDYLNQPASYRKIQELVSGDLNGPPWRPHVLHFIGHGKAAGRDACLALVDERTEQVDWCNADEMSKLFTGNWQPHLVVLQACESALPATESGFMSMAAHLFLRKIHAVVAMQFKIDNAVATTFAEEFYKALRLGWDVDEAVQHGRWKISTVLRWRDPYFGAPVLFALSPEGIIQTVEKPYSVGRVSAQALSPPEETAREALPLGRKDQGRQAIQRAIDWLESKELSKEELARVWITKASAALKVERNSESSIMDQALEFLNDGDSASARDMLQIAKRKLDMETTSGTPSEASPSLQPMRKVQRAFENIGDQSDSPTGPLPMTKLPGPMAWKSESENKA